MNSQSVNKHITVYRFPVLFDSDITIMKVRTSVVNSGAPLNDSLTE